MSFGFTLQKASHLIGEIGDVKSGRYEVHFEDESYKPCRVKHANLRIIFELPDDSTTGEDDEDYEGTLDLLHWRVPALSPCIVLHFFLPLMLGP